MGSTSNTATRRHPRFEVDLPTQHRMVGEPSWQGGRIVNLSKSGSCLEAGSGYTIGSILELQIQTTRDTAANVRKVMAMVRWIEQGKIGLEFLG